MGYPRRPPKLDCFRDLLIKLDPDVLERVLPRWITEVLGLVLDDEQLQGLSFDGKTLCGSPGVRPAPRRASADTGRGRSRWGAL